MTSAPRPTQDAVHPLRNLTLRTKQSDPRIHPEDQFTYIDVSSISSESLRIMQTSTLLGADAPSRARKTVQAGDVLFATVRPSLRRIALVPDELDGAICSTAFTVLRPNVEVLDSHFLYFQAISEQFVGAVSALQRGSSYPAVSDSDVLSQNIALPSLEEQRRIARILSTVRDTEARQRRVADVTISLEDSLSATSFPLSFEAAPHELFGGPCKWHDCTIGDQIALQRGFDITKREQQHGKVPVISSSGAQSWHSVAKVDGPGVVIGRKGSLGTAHYSEGPYWPHDTTLWVTDFKGNDPLFVYYFFRQLDVSYLDVGASNPTLNRNHLYPQRIVWPDIGTQRRIVAACTAARSSHDAASRNANAIGRLFDSLLTHLLQTGGRV